MKTLSSLVAGAIALANSQLLLAADSDTVLVSAKAPITAEEYSGSVTVISAAEIKASGATNVVDVLGTAPGITTSVSGGNSGKVVKIRGMEGEHGLVLVNGKRIPNTDRNLPFSPGYRYNWVAIENIERIEIIRGAASSIYGSDALSGVINIITKQAGEEWSGALTVDAQRFREDGGNGEGVALTAAGPLGDMADLSIALERSNEDPIYNDAGQTIKSGREVKNFQANLGVDLTEQDRLAFGVIAGSDDGIDVDASFRGGNSRNNLEHDRRLFSVDYTSKVGDFNLAAGAVNSTSELLEGSSDWKIVERDISLNLDGALNDTNYLSAGIEHRTERADRFDRNFRDEFKSWSGYVQDRIDLNDSHSLTVGASYDDHNRYDGEFSPKVYWNWQVDDNWTVKAGYSHGYIAPSIREGSSQYVIPAGPTRRYVGNDDLQPETSRTAELSLAYVADSFDATVALFNSSIDDLIATNTTVQGGVSVVQYNNVNKANIRGLESSLGWRIAEGSRLSFNYTYLDTENRSGSNKGKRLTDRPEHTANLVLNQALPYDSHLNVAWQVTGDQFTDSANNNRIGGYGTLNLGVSKSFGENFDVQATVKNLGDKQVFDGSEAIEAGREYRLSLTAKF